MELDIPPNVNPYPFYSDERLRERTVKKNKDDIKRRGYFKGRRLDPKGYGCTALDS